MAKQTILGECHGGSFQPAHFGFRTSAGRLLYGVSEISKRGPVHLTKLRALCKLTLQWDPGGGKPRLEMTRPASLWGSRWELLEPGARKLLRMTSGWLGRRWEIVHLGTGAKVEAAVKGLAIFSSAAKLVDQQRRLVAKLAWESFTWRLAAPSRVRVEVWDENWSQAAIALAVARWVALQQR